MKTLTAANESACVATLCLVMVMASLDTSIVHTALPALSYAFALSFRQAQAIVLAYLLAYLLAMTLLSVGAGRLGDALGRRRVLLGGLTLFFSASLACACAASLGMLLTARALQGAGAAVMVSLTMAFIAEVVPGAGRGRAMGLLGSMSAAGTTLGPAIGGYLLMLGGWPAIFMVNVPLGLAALVLACRFLPPDTVRKPGPRLPGAMALLRERDVCIRLGWQQRSGSAGKRGGAGHAQCLRTGHRPDAGGAGNRPPQAGGTPLKRAIAASTMPSALPFSSNWRRR